MEKRLSTKESSQQNLKSAYPNCELSPPEGDGRLDEPRSLGDGLRDLTRARGHQLGLAVLHEGGKAGLREVWKKASYLTKITNGAIL